VRTLAHADARGCTFHLPLSCPGGLRPIADPGPARRVQHAEPAAPVPGARGTGAAARPSRPGSARSAIRPRRSAALHPSAIWSLYSAPDPAPASSPTPRTPPRPRATTLSDGHHAPRARRAGGAAALDHDKRSGPPCWVAAHRTREAAAAFPRRLTRHRRPSGTPRLAVDGFKLAPVPRPGSPRRRSRPRGPVRFRTCPSASSVVTPPN